MKTIGWILVLCLAGYFIVPKPIETNKNKITTIEQIQEFKIIENNEELNALKNYSKQIEKKRSKKTDSIYEKVEKNLKYLKQHQDGKN